MRLPIRAEDRDFAHQRHTAGGELYHYCPGHGGLHPMIALTIPDRPPRNVSIAPPVALDIPGTPVSGDYPAPTTAFYAPRVFACPHCHLYAVLDDDLPEDVLRRLDDAADEGHLMEAAREARNRRRRGT